MKKGYKDTEVGVIPVEWEVEKLGDVLKVRSGEFLPQKQVVVGPYPVYGGNGVTSYHQKFLFSDSKLVVGRVGAKCGCVYISTPNSWITDNALYVSEHLLPSDINFLYFLLLSLNLNSHANQNAQPVISGAQIYSISIPLPPLPEQKKIAGVLSSVDATIESTRKVIDQTKKVKQGLLQELLTKGIGHTKFKDTEIGRIPAEWEVVKLGKLGESGIKNGVFNDPKKVGRGYRLINVVDLYSEPSIRIDNLKRLELDEKEFEKFRVEQGDLFFTRSSLKLEGIAHCNIYDHVEKDVVYDCHIMMIRPNSSAADSHFLRSFFVSKCAREYFMSHAKQVTMTTISQGDIENMPVPLPPLQEQKKIASILSSVDERITAQEKELSQLQTMKKGLMQDLLTGKVRV